MCSFPYLFLLAATFLSEANCDLRCYCNLPVCVATGYMCKSDLGTCFTEHPFSVSRQMSRHGCLELLVRPEGSATICGGGAHITEEADEAVFCCQEDMCNYVSALDVNVHIHTHKTNHSHREHTSMPVGNGPYLYSSGSSLHEALQQQDLWFKAAVIAVPIAGTFILVLLILLAAHMLKQDSRRQRHLLTLRQQQRQFNTRLLLAEAYPQKETYSCREEYPSVTLSADCFAELYSAKDFVYDRGHTHFPAKWDPFKSSTLV